MIQLVKSVGEQISNVSVGSYGTYIILKDGTALANGYNKNGCLGAGDRNSYLSGYSPVSVSNVNQITNCQETTFYLQNDGTVHGVGRRDRGRLGSRVDKDIPNGIPMVITDFPEPIRKIKAGYHSDIALSVSGEVYCWGENRFYALGVESDNELLTLGPTKLRFTRSVKDIATTTETFAAVDESGQCYGWGRNEYGELFGIQNNWIDTPMPIPYPAPIMKIEASANKIVALDIHGNVHVSGLFLREHVCKTLSLQSPIHDVQCGYQHVVMLDEYGSVYMFGAGLCGCMGTQSGRYHLESPVLVERVPKINRILAGGHQSWLFSDLHVLVAGENNNGELGVNAESKRKGERDGTNGFISSFIPFELDPQPKREVNLQVGMLAERNHEAS